MLVGDEAKKLGRCGRPQSSGSTFVFGTRRAITIARLCERNVSDSYTAREEPPRLVKYVGIGEQKRVGVAFWSAEAECVREFWWRATCMLSCAMLQRQGWSSTGHTGRFFVFCFIARGRGAVSVAKKRASGVLSLFTSKRSESSVVLVPRDVDCFRSREQTGGRQLARSTDDGEGRGGFRKKKKNQQ